MTAPWASELAALLRDDVLTTDPDVLASFARDHAPLAPAGTPSVLVRARERQHVTTTLAFANERRIPVVTRAAGTGLAGGANAIDGAIVLSVAGLDRIVRIDDAARLAVVEPGVLNGVLAKVASSRGLFYAPDPASREISTIGGNIATNAGGACCLKYGTTGDHVARLEVALADGSVIRCGAGTTKDVAGLDLKRLFVGSEGTLGVIVEATVKLLRAPRPASTLVAYFDTLRAAGEGVVAMLGAVDLSLVEVMDRTTLDAVEELTRMDLDRDAAALVLVQSDAADAPAAIERCDAIARGCSARDVLTTSDVEEGRMLLAARRMALPALERKGTTLLDDVAVPRPAIPEMMERIRTIAERRGLVIGTFGHAGDGNLHPTIVFDRTDPRSSSAAREAFEEIVRDAIALGGSITGEHGVGSLKTSFVADAVGVRERGLMRAIKLAFDPNGILNPGKGY